jgi:hypothetical protein
MADKRQVKKSIRRLNQVTTWQLFVLLILVGFIAATFLRLNNIEMVQRRSAVLSADKAGEVEAIKNRLIELQRHVSKHMNTDMGTIYLEGQYNRDTDAANAAAASDGNPNGNIFKKAQEICAPRFSNLGHYSLPYQQCVINELNKYPAASQLTSSLKLPRADSYRHTFVSPLWSPDFAGFSVLACLLIVIVIIGRLISLAVLKLILKTRYRGV